MRPKPKSIVTTQDIVIPKGTEFSCTDGTVSEFVDGNYEHIFGLTKDTFGRVIYSIDEDAELEDWFEFKYEGDI